ncbi:MAG: hypothetical protein U0X20_24835 [Caldilineaceae bacterium]
MSVEQLYCPGCAAPVSILAGTTESKCGYCGSSFRIQRSEGEIALVLSDSMTKAFAVASAQTQAAIDERSALTLDELRRMQLATEMSNLEVRLTSIEGEIRAVQRLPATKVTAIQLQQLQVEEVGLQERISEVRAVLFPEPELPPQLCSAYS